jgi:hypothetical protein
MGCNYYAKKKATPGLKANIKAHIDVEAFDEAIALIPKQIHIGKSSGGWKFLFNHNNWQHFGKTIESLQLFLKQCIITDEYGDEISYEAFWKFVETKQGGLDNIQYYNKYPAQFNGQYYQEDHFGLFFSTNTEFS